MNFAPKLIIGLGNPDKKYENTYHNVGHLFIDYMKKKEEEFGWITKPFALRSKSFMNESGRFVVFELKRTETEPDRLLIVHDDSDLEIGKLKLDFDRGAAGHHGVESIQQHLKTNRFWRLRIGIRPKQAEGEERMKAEEFVLKKISPADKKILEKVFAEITEKLK